VNAYILCGQAYFYLSEDDRAISLFNSALNFNRNDEDTLVWRSLAYINKNQFGKAIRDLSDAIKINPAPGYFYQRGISYLRLSDYEKALSDFIAALLLDPRDKDLQAMLESCLLTIIKGGFLEYFELDDINYATEFLRLNNQLVVNESINKKLTQSRFALWKSDTLSATTINSDVDDESRGFRESLTNKIL
jgi:tetratricopeptide (TPR) repeat protein